MASGQAGRLIAAGVLTLTSAWPSALFAGQVGPNSRAEATKIVAEMRRIVTPQGFERLERVRIGGIDQWISVRGFDRRNPVLLYIHGGPGSLRYRQAGITSADGKSTSRSFSGTSAEQARPILPMTPKLSARR
jgi:hypothetical protein